MTELLTRVIKKVDKLPKEIQNEIARSLLEDIEGELKWDETLKKSSDKLKKLADNALDNFKEGRTQEKGFDEV